MNSTNKGRSSALTSLVKYSKLVKASVDLKRVIVLLRKDFIAHTTLIATMLISYDRVTDWISSYNIKYSGFQNYAICNPVVVAHLPDNISFARGSVLPLAISTSAMGLYPSARLGLPLPQATTPEPLGKVILVWGGASSCGSAAIQLAVASGATVVSTASSKNHEFVKRVGATAVLDYHNANIVDEMIALIKETPGQFAGALDAIGIEETWRACAKIAKALGDGRVATTWPGEVIYAADGVEVIGSRSPIDWVC